MSKICGRNVVKNLFKPLIADFLAVLLKCIVFGLIIPEDGYYACDTNEVKVKKIPLTSANFVRYTVLWDLVQC